jgi:vacuolar protein sorting-associated protein 26
MFAELFYDRGNHYEFTSLLREFEGPGILSEKKTFEFEFPQVEKQFESYNGINVRLRYFLKFTMTRSFASNITKELDLWVNNFADYPDINNSIKMEVGIEGCLHIEFEYNRSKYHLKDVIIGKIFFLLVRIKIKHMEIALIKRESTGSGPNLYNESETLTKFEIMDGDPVRGESIPVRLFLGGFDLTPTYRNIHNKFSLKYFLNLVLIDEQDRRYFKQQEITLWRKGPTSRRPKRKRKGDKNATPEGEAEPARPNAESEQRKDKQRTEKSGHEKGVRRYEKERSSRPADPDAAEEPSE